MDGIGPGGRGRHVAASLAGLVLWLPLCASARDATDCTRLDNDAERLACYDSLHGRSPSPPATSPAPQALAPAPPSAPARAPRPTSAFDERWDLGGHRGSGLFTPRPYKPVYVLPLSFADRKNTLPTSPAPGHDAAQPLVLKDVEAKFQLSLKVKMWEDVLGTPAKLWFGYSQSSRWQVYTAKASRPFRETNYEPELIFVWPVDYQLLGWRARMVALALNHQSNGQSLPLSRSWNRVIGEVGFERDDWTLEIRPWLRVRERAEDDDNPDITDHVGRADLRVTRAWRDHVFALQLRHSLRGGSRSRWAAQLEWAFPVTGSLHGYLQWFRGYGESLIDYNFRQTRLGLGVSIVEWR